MTGALCTFLATTGTIGAALGLTAAPAYANSCSTQVPPGAVDASVPWPQQRYGLDRLSGIADGARQVVAVVDSGVDAVHPQLVGAVVDGIDGLDAGGDGRLDCVGHGTAVASIIAARPVRGVGFSGLAPAATILPVRVSERQDIDGASSGRAVTVQGLAQAIVHAVDRQVDVINLSLVTYQDASALRKAVGYALSHDVVVVAAAGNEHSAGDPLPYPAAYPGVIGVGAIGQDGMRYPESQVGPYVDLVAPGDQITAATPKAGHAVYQGTSFAVPFVAGTAALVRQYHPDLSAAEVAARLAATADPAPGGPGSADYGAGIVSPYRAVTGQVAGSIETRQAVPPLAPRSDAQVSRDAAMKRTALVVAGTCGLVAVIIVVVAATLPRGIRRRWRVGLP
ncbi:MAG: type VII secretion-associated serine protease mycosin [Dactylosporangium sp.]|nr:type VII secretion-associated serine protease mycosin [Dactylosporangium sp.]NNJ61988.1 type VII secretion-associated serine protease mycosin [Dactylosporangium sp.]